MSEVRIGRLSVALEGVPGVEPGAFRTALVRALGDMDLSRLGSGEAGALSLPPLTARRGESAEALARRAAAGIAAALTEGEA
ncbi:hypothetical protein [Rhodovulum sulfidophilum]|uniref:hypothetical protein n=1 Tax=Rhodovulum sulfidophilum TaxID=35806 RepID=UPI0009514116|nr:hypothetical protein [Rhodovulum sulfidophilum]OLS52129.1 hypothetical protein BV392_09065 [Rhodovulum sulfidophilum]